MRRRQSGVPFLQQFPHGRKVTGPAVQEKAVETIFRIFFSPQLSGLFFQGEDFKISQIIFQIITGLLYDIIVDGPGGSSVRDAEGFQHFGYLAVRSALMVDHDVDQGIEA